MGVREDTAASERAKPLKRAGKSKRSAPIRSRRSALTSPRQSMTNRHHGSAHGCLIAWCAACRKGTNGKASGLMTFRLAKPWTTLNGWCSKRPTGSQDKPSASWRSCGIWTSALEPRADAQAGRRHAARMQAATQPRQVGGVRFGLCQRQLPVPATRPAGVIRRALLFGATVISQPMSRVERRTTRPLSRSESRLAGSHQRAGGSHRSW
jgi:hypothetical protein